MKNILYVLVLALISFNAFTQTPTIRTIEANTFTVTYSEIFQQPLEVTYYVECPAGKASRKGLNFYEVDSVITSNNNDYRNNDYDKGHLAPAAHFTCNNEMVRSTFSYLNCALQHKGLNRGPWKELERFERNLAKVYSYVLVTVKVHFEEGSYFLPTGAKVPSGFTKTIEVNGDTFDFYFPNIDVSGMDWNEFVIY